MVLQTDGAIICNVDCPRSVSTRWVVCGNVHFSKHSSVEVSCVGGVPSPDYLVTLMVIGQESCSKVFRINLKKTKPFISKHVRSIYMYIISNRRTVEVL